MIADNPNLDDVLSESDRDPQVHLNTIKTTALSTVREYRGRGGGRLEHLALSTACQNGIAMLGRAIVKRTVVFEAPIGIQHPHLLSVRWIDGAPGQVHFLAMAAKNAMDNPTPAAEWIGRIRAGDAEAAAELFARYGQRLTRLAEQHLSRKLSARLDGEDVIQSVFRTFFRRTSQGEFRIDSSAQLWRLLVRITVRKAQALGRHETAGRRSVAAEVTVADDVGFSEAVARDPGPEEAAILVEQIESLLRGLPELYCHVLEMRLQGQEVAKIAIQLRVSRQTVYRALQLLQQRLARNADAVEK